MESMTAYCFYICREMNRLDPDFDAFCRATLECGKVTRTHIIQSALLTVDCIKQFGTTYVEVNRRVSEMCGLKLLWA